MQIKKLVWKQTDDNIWLAYTPAGNQGSILVVYEEGKHWPCWDSTLPGYDYLQEAFDQGQKFHEEYIKQFLE